MSGGWRVCAARWVGGRGCAVLCAFSDKLSLPAVLAAAAMPVMAVVVVVPVRVLVKVRTPLLKPLTRQPCACMGSPLAAVGAMGVGRPVVLTMPEMMVVYPGPTMRRHTEKRV